MHLPYAAVDRHGAGSLAGVAECRRESRDTSRGVTGLTPYIHLPGTAREAVSSYAEVLGGSAQLFTFSEFSRTDGPADAIAHRYLIDAPVSLYVRRLPKHVLRTGHADGTSQSGSKRIWDPVRLRSKYWISFSLPQRKDSPG